MRNLWLILLSCSLVGCGPSPSSESGCKNDQDCKGDRICEDNECVDPGSDGGSTDLTDGGSGEDVLGSDAGGSDDAGDGGATGEDTIGKNPNCPELIDDRPAALSEHAGIFDPVKERLVFHGGNPEFPVQCFGKNSYVPETWAYWPRCGQWELISSEGPSPRGRSSAVYDSDRHAMFLFGGRFRPKGADMNTKYTLYDETWWLDLKSDKWSQISAKGDIPSSRVSASAIYDPKGQRIVMFGGNTSTSGASYVPLNDLLTFDVLSAQWTMLLPANQGPSKRLFAAAVYDSKRHAMVLTTGGDHQAFLGPFLGDTWSLSLDTLEWTQLHNGIGSNVPARRIWGRAVYSAQRDRIIMMGGHDDGQLGNRNDLWQFDIENKSWELIQINDTFNKPSNKFCDFPADFANIVEGTPERRSAHLLVYWEQENSLLVHGGKTDCGQVDDLWQLELSDHIWTDLESATVGEVCLRISDECSSLCN
jgi:hypothetical protein